MKQTSLRVEFFGLPGVGKSILSNRVSEILLEHNLPVSQKSYFLAHKMGRIRRVVDKLLYVLKELIFHPNYSFNTINAILNTRQRTIKDLIKVTFNWLFVSSLLRNSKNRDGIHLIDEGIFQALWSVMLSGNDEAFTIMQPILLAAPLPEIMVIPEASLETIKLRMAGRKRHDSRLEKGKTDTLGQAHLLFDEIKNVLLKMIEHSSRMSFYKVQNDQEMDLQTNAQNIAAMIGDNLK